MSHKQLQGSGFLSSFAKEKNKAPNLPAACAGVKGRFSPSSSSFLLLFKVFSSSVFCLKYSDSHTHFLELNSQGFILHTVELSKPSLYQAHLSHWLLCHPLSVCSRAVTKHTGCLLVWARVSLHSPCCLQILASSASDAYVLRLVWADIYNFKHFQEWNPVLKSMCCVPILPFSEYFYCPKQELYLLNNNSLILSSLLLPIYMNFAHLGIKRYCILITITLCKQCRHIYMYICMYTYMYIHIHTHIHVQIHVHLEKLYKKWAYSKHRPFKLDFNLGSLTEEKVIKALAGSCQVILCSKNY